MLHCRLALPTPIVRLRVQTICLVRGGPAHRADSYLGNVGIRASRPFSSYSCMRGCFSTDIVLSHNSTGRRVPKCAPWHSSGVVGPAPCVSRHVLDFGQPRHTPNEVRWIGASFVWLTSGGGRSYATMDRMRCASPGWRPHMGGGAS